MKKCESRLGALLGVNGAIYALRKEEYVPIAASTLVDDFVIPLAAKLKNGKAIIYDSDAVAWEETPPEIADEFRRRSRIGAGGFQAMLSLWRGLLPAPGWGRFLFSPPQCCPGACPFFFFCAL